MSDKLESIEERFSQFRFGGDCADLRGFVQEVLAIPDAERRACIERHYELLSNIVKSLFLEACGGTLSTEEKLRILTLIQSDWSDDAQDSLHASMLTLLGLIQPLAGAPEWILSIAERQHD